MVWVATLLICLNSLCSNFRQEEQKQTFNSFEACQGFIKSTGKFGDCQQRKVN